MADCLRNGSLSLIVDRWKFKRNARCEVFRMLSRSLLSSLTVVLVVQANRRRQRNMQRASVCGHEVAARALGVDDPADEQQLLRRLQEAHFGLDDGPTKDLDLCMKGKTDEYQNKISRSVASRHHARIRSSE